MTRAVRLPDGRAVMLAPDVLSLLHCGVLAVESVRVATAPGLIREVETCAADLRQLYSGKMPAEIGALQEARRLYRSAGMEPTRHRPSSEALLRRVLKGKPLYVINNVVDACNLSSLKFLLPIGLYDLDRLQGDVTLRLGREGEQYAGIRKGAVNLAQRLGLFDQAGPFGSPTSDSERTCVTEQTRRLLAIVMATRAYPLAAMRDNLDFMADLFARHCHGQLAFSACLREEDAAC